MTAVRIARSVVYVIALAVVAVVAVVWWLVRLLMRVMDRRPRPRRYGAAQGSGGGSGPRPEGSESWQLFQQTHPDSIGRRRAPAPGGGRTDRPALPGRGVTVTAWATLLTAALMPATAAAVTAAEEPAVEEPVDVTVIPDDAAPPPDAVPAAPDTPAITDGSTE